jgi:transketolase
MDGFEELESIARKIRFQEVKMSYSGKAPHLGSALSCVDLLVAAYFAALDLPKDRLILSKGHAASALYAVLAAKGYFPDSMLDEYNRDGAALPEHPSPGTVPGIEFGTGSLGHGLSVGAGYALANKILGHEDRIFVLMSDGECNEGAVWEAAQFAPAKKLGQLVAIIDYNKWQATGRSDEILQLKPLMEKWAAFGWDAMEIDGHDFGQILRAFQKQGDKPKAVIAHTVKGKGISFMEDDNNWHYRIPTAQELENARQELFG